MTCAVCGRPLPEDAKFCPTCGTPVSGSLGTEERKVVTVLFADLVDSTGLARQLDAERAREVLGHFFDAVSEQLEALRGRAEKFIGDAVMAVFGLPQVHEDDAVRAVRAGLAIRARVRRLSEELALGLPLEVRVGVEAGEAATGIGPSGQMLVTGAVVNAAARLQTAAGPGEVLAGATAHALTENAVSFGERRDVAAKGFDEPLAAYPVEGLSSRSVRRTIPFVGRANELTILRDHLTRVVATGRPLLFTILGESGIGKSRLADEFVSGVDPDTVVLVGRSYLSTDSATFAPAAGMVRDLAGIDHGDPSETALSRLRELVERWIPPGADGGHERIVDRLGLLLGLSEPRRDESAFVQEVRSGFLALVEGIATTHPLVLLFEDVHALRPPMQDLVERVTARGRHGPGTALVLATGRPDLCDLRPTWGTQTVNQATLRLEALAPEDAAALARQASGGKLNDHEAAALAARAGGNPFFIVESTGAMLGGSPAGALPPTVRAVVASRIDSLPAAQRDLARRLAVFIDSFDEDEAGLVATCTVDDLEALEDAEIVVRQDGGQSTRWRMRHETLREVAYASLPKRLRLQLHMAIAEALLAGGHVSYAAEHVERAALASRDLDPEDRSLPDRATEALAAAGDRARRRMESRSAVDYYERALAMAGPDDRWGVREARALAGLGEARYWLGEYPQASEALRRAIALGEAHDDDLALALALRYLGDIAINVEADLDEAERLLDRSLAAAESLGDPWAVSRTLLFAGWVPWSRERFDEAEPLWQRSLELAREHDDRWAQVRALTSLSINHENLDDTEGAVRLIEEAQALAEAMDDQFSFAVAATQRARLYEDTDHNEEAVDLLDRAIPIFMDLGARWEYADAMAERGISLRELGRLDEAEDDLHRAVHLVEDLGERQLAAWVWRALARVSERRGDRAKAESRFRRAAEEEARRPR